MTVDLLFKGPNNAQNVMQINLTLSETWNKSANSNKFVNVNFHLELKKYCEVYMK